MKLKQLLYAFVTTLLCIPFLADHSVAASWTTCSGHPIGWSGGTSTLKFLPISFPQGHVWREKFEKAVEAWNDVPGNGLTFSLTDDVNNNWNHTNGVSEVYWYNLNDPSFLAVTYTRYDCYWSFGWNYRYTEADIAFDTADSWSTYFTYSNASSPPYSFD